MEIYSQYLFFFKLTWLDQAHHPNYYEIKPTLYYNKTYLLTKSNEILK